MNYLLVTHEELLQGVRCLVEPARPPGNPNMPQGYLRHRSALPIPNLGGFSLDLDEGRTRKLRRRVTRPTVIEQI